MIPGTFPWSIVKISRVNGPKWKENGDGYLSVLALDPMTGDRNHGILRMNEREGSGM